MSLKRTSSCLYMLSNVLIYRKLLMLLNTQTEKLPNSKQGLQIRPVNIINSLVCWRAQWL